ncbi:MAG: hypothetical protein MUC87_21400 [Bacteroidia bacterium]|jgi:hypothetical protein|nr:hypothetical protein [Bacteroidia bacterium]
MDSNALLSLLNYQYNLSGSIIISDLQNEYYTAVFVRLGIPDEIKLTGGSWYISGENVAFDGSISDDSNVLGLLSGNGIHFSFVPDQACPGEFILNMLLDLPATWVFGQSFALLNNNVYRNLLIDTSPGNVSQLHVKASASVVQNPDTDFALLFNGYFDKNSSIIGILAYFMGSSNQIAVSGPIQYYADTGAVDMNLPLAVNTVSGFPGSRSTSLVFTLSLFSGVNERLDMYEAGVMFETDLILDHQTIRFKAIYYNSLLDSISLVVSSISLNLESIAENLGIDIHNNPLLNRVPLSVLDTLSVSSIMLQIDLENLSIQYGTFKLTALENSPPWNLWPGYIALSDLEFSCSVYAPFTADFYYECIFSGVTLFGGDGGLPLRITASLPDFNLEGHLNGEPYSLNTFLTYFFGATKGLPDALYISRINFKAVPSDSVYSFAFEVTGHWSIPFGESNTLDLQDILVTLLYDEDGPQGQFIADFFIGANRFIIELDLSEENQVLYGQWIATDVPLDYQDIAIAFGMYGLPNIPPGLDLALSSASFSLQTEGPSAAFSLTSDNYGSAAMILGKDENGNWGFVFGMLTGLEASLNLTDIDVVGNFVPSGVDTISIDNLRFVGATQAIPLFTPNADLLRVLTPVINSGLVLSVDLNIGSLYSETFTVRFGGLNDGTANDTPPSESENGNESENENESESGNESENESENESGNNSSLQLDTTVPTAAMPGPTSAWIDVQRAFGPVHINRIGFRITEDNSLGILLDADVKLAGLTIGLDALEADIPIESPFWPSFSLGGLEVGYTAPGFMLAGGLQKLYGSDPAQYTGELIVQAGNFGATAFGSYTTVNGDPSLFAFLALNVPIGGPPFCVVTGLSLGFGYNRRLILPDISNLQTYPLVQAAMGITDPQATINALNQYIVPAQNQYWLAAGIRFTSFEMLNAYALLTASFGTQVELALMGEALLALPVAMPGEPELILAQADMVLMASITPSLGQIAINAQLTSRSFVLDRNAQITGGFAFYFWYGKSAHKGDFVVTLGGYNPHFNKPDYYPSVPQLGLNWKISNLISIKGGLYCALTPSVIMAGGNLSATYQSGDVKAWFTANADFLMRYKPFSFDASMAVSVGASYKLNLWLTTKTVSVTVGANLHLWGPEFAGSAVVDLKVMSFTINFGAARVQPPSAISWNEFRQSFLPPEPQQSSSSTLSLDQQSGAIPTRSLITFTASDGLLGAAPAEALGIYGASLPAGSNVWRIDSSRANVSVNLAIPANDYMCRVTNETSTGIGSYSEFGIGPMGISPADIHSHLDVVIQYNGSVDYSNIWTIIEVKENVPAGLWLNTTNSMTGQALVMNQLAGLNLSLYPVNPSRQNSVLPISIDALLFGNTSDPRSGNWSVAVMPGADNFDQSNAMSVVQQTLTNSSVAQNRSDMLDVLNAMGFAVYGGDEISLDRYAAQLPELVYSAPQLRFTGEPA